MTLLEYIRLNNIDYKEDESENLTVGGWLDLEGCTGITSLPENLTVGGALDLRGTGITSLPDNLTVGEWLDLRGTGITLREREKVKKLTDGDYVPGRYLYADTILTHVSHKKSVGEYDLYVGKIPGKNIVSDRNGTYAHCETFSTGIKDIAFKKLKERGAEQYKELNLDSKLPFDDAVNMYRIITGACSGGCDRFISLLSEVKNEYTVREILDITKGQYGSAIFAEFFKNAG